jgi:PAS domain S-box-containing protein
VLAAIFERGSTAMLVVNHARTYLDVNAAAARLHGRPRAEMIGRTLDDFVAPERRSDLDQPWEALLGGDNVQATCELVRLDGSRVDVEYAATANFLPGRHLFIFFRLSESGANGRAVAGGLSGREREVLGLLALGATGRQIADSLELSPETVRTHVRNSMEKLGAHTRAHAIVLALRRGEIAP